MSRPRGRLVDKLEHDLVLVLDVLFLVGHVSGDDVSDVPLLEEPDHELSEDLLDSELFRSLAVVEEIVECALSGDQLDVGLQQRLGALVETEIVLAECKYL